jgi:hypothetical protein
MLESQETPGFFIYFFRNDIRQQNVSIYQYFKTCIMACRKYD